MRLYKAATSFTAVLALCLFVCLLLFPEIVFMLFGMEATASAAIMARRASMLFLGLSLICWFARDAGPGRARQGVVVGLAAAMLGLAATGVFELLRGTVGPGIWLAIATETVLGVSYAYLWATSRTLPA